MAGLDNLADPNAMTSMMQSPEFLSQMSAMMSRPEVLDQMINSNPQLAQMGPQIRQAMQSPMVQAILRDPEALRSVSCIVHALIRSLRLQMMSMQAAMGRGGGNPFGGAGGAGGNPFGGAGPFGNPFGAGLGAGAGGAGAGAGGAAALTGAAAQTGSTNTPNDPFPNLFAAGQAAQTGAPGAGAGAGAVAGRGAGAAGAPFGGVNWDALNRAMMAGMAGQGEAGAGAGAGAGEGAGAGAGGGNPMAMYQNMFGGMGGTGGMGGFGFPPAPPADTRPPEELYATQLGQLNGMGLHDFTRNVRALRMTGGNVEAAIELLFSGQLDNQ